MTEDLKDIRQKLMAVDVNEHTETKGKFTYLSWAWAVAKMNELCSGWTYQYVKDDGGNYSHQDRTGFFVETSVTVEGITLNETLPVLDFKNNPIKQPTAFHINTSLKRCLTKNFAMFGLGLYIYAGEDTAYYINGEEPEAPKASKAQTTHNPFKDGDSQSGYESVSLEDLIGTVNAYKEMRQKTLDVKDIKLMSELTIMFPEVTQVTSDLGIEAKAPKDLKPNEISVLNAKLVEITGAKDALVKQAKANQEQKKAEEESETPPPEEPNVFDN